MRRLLIVAVLLASGIQSALGTVLDVPGSVPGTTTVFATDRGITVGTYDYAVWTGGVGTYGFIFDGSNYRTFLPGYIGPPLTAGSTDLPFDFFRSFDVVDISSFNKNGGIAYYAYNSDLVGGADCCGFVRSGIGNNFSTEVDLRAAMGVDNGGAAAFVSAPDGGAALVVNDVAAYPMFVNNIGQVVGDFYNCYYDPCTYGLIARSGQFLMSDGKFYYNFTVTNGDPEVAGGFQLGQRVTEFVENGNSGIYRIIGVPEPGSLALIGIALLGLAFHQRKRLARGKRSVGSSPPTVARQRPS